MSDTETSQRLGKYEVLEEIGKGGFATVYRARDSVLGREVALKVLAPQLLDDEVWEARFFKEARAVARLEHPHIATIYEIAEVEGRLFIAMQLVRGGSLADGIAQDGPVPWEQTVDIVSQVADALEYAHGEGVFHRDLKPANVLLDERLGAVLTDFGFASIVGEHSMSLSLSGGVVGTPNYIAPEIWEGETATPQTDLYALGCILYEMVTADKVFPGDTPPAVMRAHFKPLALPETWPPGVPGGVEAVLRQALAGEPGERYPNPAALAAALEVGEVKAEAKVKIGVQAEAVKGPLMHPAAAARQGPVWRQIGIEMVPIPAGEFLYGDDKEKVYLPEYFLARTPVTNDQYKNFVEATAHPMPEHWENGEIPTGKENHPVVEVSWEDAEAFCQWAGCGLPTEQEWEKGSRGTDGREYPWGNGWEAGRCNTEEARIGHPTPVHKYPQGASAYGLLDMAGNVWEWCQDRDDEDPDKKVVRGGSWLNDRRWARSAFRFKGLPGLTVEYFGFRCGERYPNPAALAAALEEGEVKVKAEAKVEVGVQAEALEGQPLRRTDSGLVIATPENIAQLLALTDPPRRIWWERAEMELCLVPAGEFLMGISEKEARRWHKEYGGELEWYTDATPQHRVTLQAFYMGRTPVTQAQYARFVRQSDHPVPFRDDDWAKPYNWNQERKTFPQGKADHPVVLVSWHDAVAYCRWAGLRLPTEAEWEKAASWGPGTGQKRVYPWGDQWDSSKCNSAERIAGRELPTYSDWKKWYDGWLELDEVARIRDTTTPVGIYSPAGDSPYGCADMAGNVWEWTGSLYDPYPYHAEDGREDPDAEGRRVVRGGSWDFSQVRVRSADRNWGGPGSTINYGGYRCCVA